MNKKAMVEILTVLQKHHVPLQHGVALICKAQDRKLSDLASACNYHRNSLYKALMGDIPAQPEMIEAVKNELGIDPWLYANTTQVEK